eukprot:gnl/TRDRNA2_/TRDRNA2_188091_c0_seq1.p1 gnl/TRDRNA2_/TRDRNA2_188091_c0~~gnl/TRDRNA2_/TRDRNA2_188091_c0_seq1.p1  ORF type:complete len:183 (+),score=25.71 gnl/TRDRNA2_/TRDRNA2_188091_c0_seq1:130-678(+)
MGAATAKGTGTGSCRERVLPYCSDCKSEDRSADQAETVTVEAVSVTQLPLHATALSTLSRESDRSADLGPKLQFTSPRPSRAAASAKSSRVREALAIDFERIDGTAIPITFTRRPLGIDFDQKAPMIVKRVLAGSHAEEVGVLAGWTIRCIDGEETYQRDFTYQYETLMAAADKLPTGLLSP